VTLDTTIPEAGGNVLVSERQVPWMTLGQLVDEPMTATEAAKLGGLDFDVELRPVYYGAVDGGDYVKITNRRAVIRSDTGTPLGIVSKNYPVLQYGEAFSFMDGVSPHYVAAGALKGGRQGFMVVKAPGTTKLLTRVDPHDLYLVLRTSHDCTRAIEVTAMPLRGRCMNQLTLRSFTSGVPYRWTVRHTTTMRERLAEAQLSLENLGAYGKQYETVAKRLIEIKITKPQATKLLENVFPDRPQRGSRIEQILSSWTTDPTVGFDGTGWGLLNAVSGHMEWQRPGGNPESRFVGALQGPTHQTINRVAARLLSRA